MTDYIDKEKLLEAISNHCHSRYDDIITKIEDGEFDIPEGYMLASIEDYNNKSKLLKEKDAEITQLKKRIEWWSENAKDIGSQLLRSNIRIKEQDEELKSIENAVNELLDKMEKLVNGGTK